MNILIVVGHPHADSFNHALAERCRTECVKRGHRVVLCDLYKDGFNPLAATRSPLIAQYCEDLKTSDGIIVVHPNWWGQPPAIVKGWLDCVFLPNVAYCFEKDLNGVLVQKGLLKAQFALVLNTSNTSNELEESLYKDPLETIWKNRVFGFCGVPNFKRLNFTVMIESDFETRNSWLHQVAATLDMFIAAK